MGNESKRENATFAPNSSIIICNNDVMLQQAMERFQHLVLYMEI